MILPSSGTELSREALECLEKDPARRPQTAAELQETTRACRSFGAWDRDRARRWWHENGEKVRSGDLPALQTMTRMRG